MRDIENGAEICYNNCAGNSEQNSLFADWRAHLQVRLPESPGRMAGAFVLPGCDGAGCTNVPSYFFHV